MPLFDLPVEILLNITDYLDDSEMNALACTNKSIHSMLNEHLYRRDMTGTSRSLTHWAVTGVVGTIQRAVHAGQHLNPVPKSFHTALQLAIGYDQVPIIELLLKVKGINPNFSGDWFSPLLLAANKGNSAIVELLLANVDIDPNVRDPLCAWLGATPLLYACLWGHVSVVRQLLARDNVDVNCMGFIFNRYVTPLTAACINYKKLMEELVEAPVGDRRSYIFQWEWDRAATTNIKRYPLLEISKILLEREDVDINLPDGKGRTALFWACRHNCLELVDLLLEKDHIDPNVRDIKSGRTPLAEACRVGSNPAIVRSLLLSHRGVDPNAVDNNGVSPLAHLLRNRFYGDAPEIKTLLLAASAKGVLY
ncbi:Ankyrin repeat-containing domain protein [Elaphomyces granulatus]|jgi:ankyrin repeat protein